VKMTVDTANTSVEMVNPIASPPPPPEPQAAPPQAAPMPPPENMGSQVDTSA
jgi:hypothetical protein